MNGGGSNTGWSRDENNTFESALVVFQEDSPDRWESIAGFLPGKSPADVLAHYEILVADVADIEAGNVEVPDYPQFPEAGPSRSNRSLCKRTKGVPWTIEEHRLFLQGIDIYGRSNWREITRNLLQGRLTSQVASHAQKFFKRKANRKKDGMRASIHDITTVSECDALLEGRSNDAATATTFATAIPGQSPSLTLFDASASSQGRSNNVATATAVTGAYARFSPSLNTFDASASSQGRSNNVATATAVTGAYARFSPSLNTFDASASSQGRSNNVATATAVTGAYARFSPSLNTFDASASSQGRSNNVATATAVTGAYARFSPSLNTFDASASSQERGQGYSPFNSN
ncbi:hypothetical protein AAHA92_24629 [Salvia divinorum]|uniref:MYB transcription factor n=1 Tax=Salvia divinorum TaxID=28513 RepID=A0ABD1GB28_SALDI